MGRQRVGLLAEPRDALTEAEMLTTAGASEHSDSSASDDGLPRLADHLRKYGTRALAGDPQVFEEARALRRRYTEHYTRRSAE